MKYYTFVFRDLDNNVVLAKPDHLTKELTFEIIQTIADKEDRDPSIPSIEDISTEKIVIVRVDEPQEDIIDLIPLYEYTVTDEQNRPLILAEYAESNIDGFINLANKLYITILEDIANQLQNK